MEGIKVYEMDDYSSFATNLTLEATIEWYKKEFGEEPYDIDEIKEVDIETKGMWVETDEEKDVLELGEADELFYKDYSKTKEHVSGDLMRRGYSIFKFTLYKDVIKSYGVINEPFEISTTEW
jgi:acyl-ACP thioesterase